PSQALLGVSQTVYVHDPALNPGDLLSNASASFYVPWTIGQDYLSFSGSANNSIAPLYHQRSLFTGFGAAFPNMQLLYAFSYSQVNSGSGYEVNLAQSSPGLTLRAPASLILRGGFTYDHLNNDLQSINAGLDRTFFQRLFLEVS